MAEKSSISPEGESLRAALKWLAMQRALDRETDRRRLIEEASVRFDLTPLEAEFLYRNFESPRGA